jgi:inorganic pyrophosphatase
MRKAFKRLKAFDPKTDCLNVLVETPKSSRVKYTYNPELGLFELKKALPEGMMFPFNFGFIPGTKADDGDPLDILILNQEPLIPGCLLKARLLGVLEAEQSEDGKTTRNDRLIGVAIEKQTPASLQDMDLDKRTLSEIEYFFVSYNKLAGKKFRVCGKSGPKKALEIVRRCEKNCEKEFKWEEMKARPPVRRGRLRFKGSDFYPD